MKAFHNDQKIKTKYVDRIKMHRELDHLIQGVGWDPEGEESEDGRPKGCAVGCTLENYDHQQYEVELGIPEWLARVEDTIFEGLAKDRAMSWPQEFLEAVNVGSDLSKVEAPFVISILESNLSNFDHEKYPDVKAAIEECIRLHKIGGLAPSPAWGAAENAAWGAARRAAESAGDSAARSAAGNEAESAAWNAAESAAWSATRIAVWIAVGTAARSAAGNAERSAARRAAWNAAESAAWSAVRNTAGSAVRNATRRAAYEKFAAKLLELLKECK